MRKKGTRKARRFHHGVTHDPLRDLIYCREAWVFRTQMRWWATPDQLHAVNRALAAHFHVPVPRLSMRLTTNAIGGHFHVSDDGTHWIHVRGPKFKGWWKCEYVNNKCERGQLKSRVEAGKYHVHTLLHEWAHYLAYLWWGDGAHDVRFCAVDEITHEWYARRRKREHRLENKREPVRSS